MSKPIKPIDPHENRYYPGVIPFNKTTINMLIDKIDELVARVNELEAKQPTASDLTSDTKKEEVDNV